MGERERGKAEIRRQPGGSTEGEVNVPADPFIGSPAGREPGPGDFADTAGGGSEAGLGGGESDAGGGGDLSGDFGELDEDAAEQPPA